MSRPTDPVAERVALHVMGLLSAAESVVLETEAARNPDLRAQLDAAQEAMAELAIQAPVTPPPTLRPKVFAAVRQSMTDRIAQGRPPVLHPGSRATDYALWLNDPVNTRPAEAGPVHVIELDEQDGELTALVWLTHGSPEEVHVDVVEKFLILEGSCEIHIGEERHTLVPGSYLSIPLHVPHTVCITSQEPCKFVLQRIAA